MKNPENDKWLDDVLSETIGSEKPKTDFEKWKQEHRQAVEMLTSKAGRDSSISQGPLSIWSIIMKSPVTKLAAAAVLFFGLFMLGRLLIGSETPQDPNQTRTTTTTQEEDQNDTNRLQILLDSELEIAKHLFEKKDLPGLMQFLQKCQEPTKLQIAEYLGQIGDSSVLSDLQIYAEKWQGPELENPFCKAIEAIQARQAEPEP